MAYETAVDSSKAADLSTQLINAATQLSSDFGEIFSKIDGLENYWSGVAYDTFKKKCHDFKPAMDTLVAVLQAYASLLSTNVNNAAEVLDASVQSAFDTVTG